MSSQTHRPIVSTLGFIMSPDRGSVLMVHRVYKEGDENLGKYNGVGGKLERGEDVAAGMAREVREETGLEIGGMSLRGTVAWADFGPKKQDWIAFIFLIYEFSGELREASEEGPLRWVPLAEIPSLPMWKGDALFMPLVFDGDPRPFHGYMRYDGPEPVEWRFSRY